jgi:hypothetical protein
MQNFFAGEEKIAEPRLSMWSRLGPALLLGAFAALLFKCAPPYTPFIAVAFLGYAATRLWGKGGLSLSLIALVLVWIFSLRSTHELLWTALLSISIAVSWLLIYFDGQESAAFEEGWNEKIHTLDKQRQDLERQCLETRLKLSEEQRQCLAERQHAQDLSAEISLVCSQSRDTLESFEQEHHAFSEEIRSHQQKNAALQDSLSESSARISELEEQLSALTRAQETAEEETGPQEIGQQYALLREQFEEKSATLDQTRKELFRAEQDLLSLQKMTEEQELAPCEEIQAFCRDLQLLEQEVGDREHLIALLEDLATSLSLPKKRPPAKKRKALPDGGELRLESLIKS